MYFNIFEPTLTSSWTMQTFTEEGRFIIDEITGGLSFTFDCSYPCNSCNREAPSDCLSCNDLDIEGYLILYEGVCYSECPDGTYEESF
jgi:hypothetical protein